MNNKPTDTKQLKRDLLDRLKSDCPTMCRHWFEDMRVVDVVDGSIRVLIDEPVQLKYLQRCCTQQFVEAEQSVTSRLLGASTLIHSYLVVVKRSGHHTFQHRNTTILYNCENAPAT